MGARGNNQSHPQGVDEQMSHVSAQKKSAAFKKLRLDLSSRPRRGWKGKNITI